MSPKLSGKGGWNKIWVGGGGKLKKIEGKDYLVLESIGCRFNI